MVGDALAGSRGRVGRCTSVTATRMTDAYGASTHKGCSPQVGQVGRVGQVLEKRLVRIGGDAKRQSPCRVWYICSSLRVI